MNDRRLPTTPCRRETTGLMLLFGAMYFVQGIAEPTEGLVAQPFRSLLKSWDYPAAAITTFASLVALPWSLKPIYGLLSDFVPIAGTRRRSYLMLTSGTTAVGLACLYFLPLGPGAYLWLLVLLLVPTTGVAFSDVVVDGLMVEKGQPRGLTGKLQSVQWAAMYGGTIVAVTLGGWFSQINRQQHAFLLCALASIGTFVLSWFFVREEPRPVARGALRRAARDLAAAARVPAVQAAGAFLFLWSFNPFNTSILYLYMTQELEFSEQFHSHTVSFLSVGAILGSLAYATYCRRVPLMWLIHLAIAAGVLSTLAYWFVAGPVSAVIVSILVGFTYLTGCMVQYDLAARACPIAAAGTTFALLMALSNLSMSLSTLVGGFLYQAWSAWWGAAVAFNLLVAAGALATTACWLLMPLLRRAHTANGNPQCID